MDKEDLEYIKAGKLFTDVEEGLKNPKKGKGFFAKEIDEQLYDVDYFDGPTSDRHKRIEIEVKDGEDIQDKIYNRPEAKQFNYITWGKRIEGETAYMVVFNRIGYNTEGKKEEYSAEGRLLIDATDPAQANRYYNRHYKGKYVIGYTESKGPYYDSFQDAVDVELKNQQEQVAKRHSWIIANNIYQLGSITDTYQTGGANENHIKAVNEATEGQHSSSYESYIGWIKDADEEERKEIIDEIKHDPVLSDLEKVALSELIFKGKNESLNENLVNKDITLNELKSLVDNLYNQLNSLDKPEAAKIGGTYYGSTELFSHRGNMLEIVTDYTTSGSYYNPSIAYKNCYAVKIGGAYNYDDYKEKLSDLRKEFNYEVRSGWGVYDQIITSDGYKVRLIDEYGSNFSVYGIDIIEKVAGDSLNEEQLEETYSDEELDDLVGKTFNQQRILNIYRRSKYGEKKLFAHTRCTECGREKKVFLSNLIKDPHKYGSCVCSDENIDSKIERATDLYDGSMKLPNNTSGHTGVSFVKTYRGEPYNKWRAYIDQNGTRTYLGDFKEKRDAIHAREEAAKKGVTWYKLNKAKVKRQTRGKYKRSRKLRRNARKH